MIRAVLFDLDNTLLDFMKLKKKSCNAAIKAMIKAGLRMNEKKANNVLFDLYDKYGIEHSRIFQKFLLKTIGRVDWKILTAGIVAYRQIQAGYREPYPNVIKTIKALKKKGIKLGVVSDAPSLKAWIRLTEIGAVDFFDAIVAYDDTKKKKPHDLPFRLAIRKLKTQPKNILFIGDDPRRDIIGAKKSGMQTALAMYGMQDKFKRYAKSSNPDYCIKNVNEIMKIL